MKNEIKRLWDYFKVSARVELREQLVFRSNFFAGYALVIIRVLMLIALWTALYIGKETVDGVSLATMKFYTIASIIFDIFISSRTEDSISSQVRSGSISMVLTRPVSFPMSVFIEQLAFTLQNLLIRVVPYTAVLLVSGIAFQCEVFLTPAFFMSMLLAYFLMLFYQLFFGMIAFWTMEIEGFLQARDVAMTVFSGYMIPLWFFPEWLSGIAKFLPFQAMYNLPLSILVGKIQGAEIMQSLLIQLLWLVFFLLLAVFFWGKSRKRIVINGG